MTFIAQNAIRHIADDQLKVVDEYDLDQVFDHFYFDENENKNEHIDD